MISTHVSAPSLPVGVRTRCRSESMGTFTYPRGATFGPAHLTDFEFVWVIEGSSTCTIVSSDSPSRTTVALAPGTLLLTRPGMTQTYRWSDRRSTKHGYVHFRLERDGLPLDGNDCADWPLTRAQPAGSAADALCRELVRRSPHVVTGASTDPALVDTLCEALLRTFLAGDVSPVPEENGTLGRLADLVATRWARADRAESYRVHDLAAAVHLSAGHLSRLTREAFGVGPAAAVEIARLDRAAGLLERTNLTMDRIAADCGFAGPYHLSRRFGLAFGVPPSLYRRTPVERPAPAGTSLPQREALEAWSVRVRTVPVHNPA